MIEWICLALLIYIGYQDYYNRKERNRLVEAFLAKNLRELKESEKKTEPLDTVDQPTDIPLSEATPEEFDKAIKKTLSKETVMEKAKDKLKKVLKYKKNKRSK